MSEHKHLSTSGIGFIAWLLALPVSANVPINTGWRKDAINIADHGSEIGVRRDAHGRLRAPVFINGTGPFDFIVDTGANGSAVAASVADRLGLAASDDVLLRGVTGGERARAVTVESFTIGAMSESLATMPILSEALEGADGFFGTGSLLDKTVRLDFQRNVIVISDSQAATARDADAIPIDLSRAGLVTVDARLDEHAVSVIIDTGAGGTIGNHALLELIRDPHRSSRADRIVGTTRDVYRGDSYALPPLKLGSLWFAGVRASIVAVPLFERFEFNRKPALLLGMDVLGGLEELIVDYASHALYLRPRPHRSSASVD
jgi:predicted aspartyl protease